MNWEKLNNGTNPTIIHNAIRRFFMIQKIQNKVTYLYDFHMKSVPHILIYILMIKCQYLIHLCVSDFSVIVLFRVYLCIDIFR